LGSKSEHGYTLASTRSVTIRWTKRASRDVGRLSGFLAPVAPAVAASVAQLLTSAPNRLLGFPRIGERVESYMVKEVRKLSVNQYVMHYEIKDNEILILRIWHSREDRSFGET
jgi:plasmid stabilization system protein ParE